MQFLLLIVLLRNILIMLIGTQNHKDELINENITTQRVRFHFHRTKTKKIKEKVTGIKETIAFAPCEWIPEF